jgi:hypothetical protein
MSEANKEALAGMVALPVMLTVPESLAVIMVGAAKLMVAGPVTTADVRSELRIDVKNVVVDSNV